MRIRPLVPCFGTESEGEQTAEPHLGGPVADAERLQDPSGVCEGIMERWGAPAGWDRDVPPVARRIRWISQDVRRNVPAEVPGEEVVAPGRRFISLHSTDTPSSVSSRSWCAPQAAAVPPCAEGARRRYCPFGDPHLTKSPEPFAGPPACPTGCARGRWPVAALAGVCLTGQVRRGTIPPAGRVSEGEGAVRSITGKPAAAAGNPQVRKASGRPQEVVEAGVVA